MCSCYHQGKLTFQTEPNKQSNSQITTNVNTSGTSSKAKKKDLSLGLETVLGQVWVGDTHKATCILANYMKVLKGKTSKITRNLSCMIEARASNNLPMGIVVHRTMVTPN